MNKISTAITQKKRNRLSVRLVVAVLLCSSILTLLATAFQLYFDYQKDVKAIHSNIQFIQDSYLPAIISSVYTLDDKQVKTLLEGALNLLNIEYMEIKDVLNNPFKSAGKPAASKDVTKVFPLNFITPSGKVISVGTLTVSASLEGIYRRLLEKTYVILLSNMVKTFFASILILMIINHMVVRHLAKISNFTRHLSLNKLPQILTLDRRESESTQSDELAQLEKAINKMIVNIKEDADKIKAMGQSLQESEEKFRILYNNSPDMNISVSPHDASILLCNDTLLNKTGYSKKDLIGSPIFKICHDDCIEEVKKTFQKFVETGEIQDKEFIIKRKDGSKINVSLNTNAVRNETGKILYSISSWRDITERKQAQEKLQKMHILLDDTEKLGKIGGWEYDVKTQRSRWTEEVYRIYGLAPTKHDLSDLDKNISFYKQEAQSIIADAFRRAVQAGESYDLELPFLSADGVEKWVRTIGRTEIEEGRVVRVFGNIMDITDRKKGEELIRQAEKMESITMLTGGIAHDYNNLLAVIMGNLSMAQEETEPHSVMAELLYEIEQASFKARDLTNQFLTLSKGGYPRKELGSIASLLKEIPKQVQSNENIEYIIYIQDDLWSVEHDSQQIQDAVTNVLKNAVEAMPQGGAITIQAGNQIIDNKEKDPALPLNEGRYVKISVKDEGRGIPEEHLVRIFDPYFSTKERGAQKGMGLGLTTAYAVVEKHGGHIEVNSTIDVGTTITIYLPAAEEIEKKKSTRQKGDDITPSISGVQPTIQRILVMDDEESLRNLAEKMLIRLGYEVKTVKDGDDAIDLYIKCMDSGNPFKAVILDLTIKGGMGGDQAIKELIKIDPDVKAIVCSGYFNDPVLAHFEEHGFIGAMAKPYQKGDLERLLKEILG